MITLVSSSSTRAKILSLHKIDFKQIKFDFDESHISRSYPPNIYVSMVANSKKEQFLKVYPDTKDILFADSCVFCNNQILGKATSEKEAIDMLKIQSNNEVSVISAIIFVGSNFNLESISETKYTFATFKDSDIEDYIKSGDFWGKAGAMMVEGFNKKYILSQKGSTENAMGLDVSILKAFI